MSTEYAIIQRDSEGQPREVARASGQPAVWSGDQAVIAGFRRLMARRKLNPESLADIGQMLTVFSGSYAWLAKVDAPQEVAAELENDQAPAQSQPRS